MYAHALLIALMMAVLFVNGWTDAPNAITGAVATKAMTYRSAVATAAVCNLLGLLVMSAVNASVADTITGMVDFSAAGDAGIAFAALLAALVSIVVFAVAAWRFGIPTSESHALIAALTGAAIGAGSPGAVNIDAWKKIIAGLIMSLALGFLFGRLFARFLGGPLQRLPGKALDRCQMLAAAGAAFMHGAQDGQKFAAVFVIAELLAKNQYHAGPVDLRGHPLVLALCAAGMALGTSVGGKRIIDTVGSRMVSLEKHQSVCADLGSGLCLLLASLWGIPMSTTHAKTTAIMGAGMSGEKNPAVIGEMFVAWAVTFPVCGALGFILTRLFIGLGAGI